MGGRVREVPAREGDAVAEGDILVMLDEPAV
ncbi:MAG: biotin/lipoyl-binding protein [Gracilibacteraceae bacterium]|nr:biotin/lipoyl-binding protein [Gracilibacteraceae bacterium]